RLGILSGSAGGRAIPDAQPRLQRRGSRRARGGRTAGAGGLTAGSAAGERLNVGFKLHISASLSASHGGNVGESFETINGTPSYNLYINGEWVRSLRNESTESTNPATGELFARVQQAGKAETERAIAAAHGAYKAWAGSPVSEREAVFFRAADVLASKA